MIPFIGQDVMLLGHEWGSHIEESTIAAGTCDEDGVANFLTRWFAERGLDSQGVRPEGYLESTPREW